ncbi:MAG: hypothetical protein WD066_16925 [Planctomycetaceae bacterium]
MPFNSRKIDLYTVPSHLRADTIGRMAELMGRSVRNGTPSGIRVRECIVRPGKRDRSVRIQAAENVYGVLGLKLRDGFVEIDAVGYYDPPDPDDSGWASAIVVLQLMMAVAIAWRTTGAFEDGASQIDGDPFPWWITSLISLVAGVVSFFVIHIVWRGLRWLVFGWSCRRARQRGERVARELESDLGRFIRERDWLDEVSEDIRNSA